MKSACVGKGAADVGGIGRLIRVTVSRWRRVRKSFPERRLVEITLKAFGLARRVYRLLIANRVNSVWAIGEGASVCGPGSANKKGNRDGNGSERAAAQFHVFRDVARY